MAIAKKPSNKTKFLTETIINKGGKTPSKSAYQNNKNIKITLRLPFKMLDIVDNYLDDSINNKTRNSWIKEAIEEKIEKEIT